MQNVKIGIALTAIVFLAIIGAAGVLANIAIDKLWDWATGR